MSVKRESVRSDYVTFGPGFRPRVVLTSSKEEYKAFCCLPGWRRTYYFFGITYLC